MGDRMAFVTAQGQGVFAIDSGYVRPMFDAIHLVVSDDGRAALVDTGTVHAVPRVLEALAAQGLAPESVDWICLTHVHLDHAGGAGALARVLPNAKVAVHARGSRHMADPSKLWEGTLAVYGQANAEALYGELIAVPAARIVEVGEGDTVRFGSRVFHVLDTPGHAKHHVCYHDPASQGVFTGDTFGLTYREMDGADGRANIFATTTPVHFDPAALHASIDRLLALKPACIYPTHYSRSADVPRLGATLHRLIDAHVQACDGIDPAATDAHPTLVKRLEAIALAEAESAAWGVQGDAALQLLEGDLDLNAQGLLVWLQTRTQ